jgi:hypothetical protein
MMKFRNVGVASTAAVMMLAAGCSSGSGGDTARLNIEKANIVIDAFPAIDSAGLYIAQMDGLFAAQGLHVTRALSQGQQIADTNRAAVEHAIEKYLQIPAATAAWRLSFPGSIGRLGAAHGRGGRAREIRNPAAVTPFVHGEPDGAVPFVQVQGPGLTRAGQMIVMAARTTGELSLGPDFQSRCLIDRGRLRP